MNRFVKKLTGFLNNTDGSIAPIFAVLSVTLMGTAAMAVDYSAQNNASSKLQEIVDSSVLAGAHTEGDNDAKLIAAREYFNSNLPQLAQYGSEIPSSSFDFTTRGTLTGRANVDIPLLLSGVVFDGPLQVGVFAEVGFNEPAATPCIYVLANSPQAATFNSGTNIVAPECEINVYSVRNPAASINSDINIDVARLCIAGENITNNAGNLPNLETGCAKVEDPFASTIPEPIIPIECRSEGPQDGAVYSFAPGKNCTTIFNNANANITFQPGVHVIENTMIWNTGQTILAEGVTFYFPNTNSQIQANGQNTIRATAPTSGDYEGVLIFESTSNPTNNANKTNYVINGSENEYLEGLIYLPNRQLIYNSDTNVQANRINLVVETLTIGNGTLIINPPEQNTDDTPTSTAYLIK